MELDSGEHKQMCKECPHKEMERCKWENYERFYGSCFQRGVNSENWIYWLLVNQTKHDHFRKILRVFHIVDNSIIPARDDQVSDWDHCLIIWITFACAAFLLVKQWQSKTVWLLAKYLILFGSTFQINTKQGLDQKSGWLLIVTLPLFYNVMFMNEQGMTHEVKLLGQDMMWLFLQWKWPNVSIKGSICLHIIFSQLMLQLHTALKEPPF